MGETRALRTIGDWRLYYFNEIPPVDFDNYMVLQAYLPVACPPSLSVTAICEGQDTIQVSLVATLQRGNDCQDIRYDWVSEAVTLSDKPVTWQIVATR